MRVNLASKKRLGIAGMLHSISLGEKCDFSLCVNVWFVIELVFQLFMRRYVPLFVCRGR